MYTRQESGARYPRVPRNYSGNAFREMPTPPSEMRESEEAPKIIEAVAEPPEASEEAVASSARHDPFRLFRSGGIGSEELLLLGLILLLSQNETKDDLLLLLVLLLFIQ